MDNRTARLDVEALKDLLLGIHFGIAAIAHAPDFALDAEEAEKLAKASCNVMRHYDVRTTQKAMDWAQLCIAMGVVYGPRIMMLAARKRERPETAPPSPDMEYAADAGIPGMTLQ